MGKVLNFDKFMSEKQRETVTVTVFGKQYSVEARIPAIVPVTMGRAEMTLDAETSTKMFVKAADMMFGKPAVDEMLAKGLSANELTELIQHLFLVINGMEESDEAEEITDEASRKTAGNKAKK